MKTVPGKVLIVDTVATNPHRIGNANSRCSYAVREATQYSQAVE